VTVQLVSDPNTPIGWILETAGSEGILLESEGQGRYALLPLDDDVIDFLIERSPTFRARFREIRERMESGQFQTHDEVRRTLSGESTEPSRPAS
jgi:hypothetical protein